MTYEEEGRLEALVMDLGDLDRAAIQSALAELAYLRSRVRDLELAECPRCEERIERAIGRTW